MNIFDILWPGYGRPVKPHTAGAVRIGLAARKLLGEPPVKAAITLSGSFSSPEPAMERTGRLSPGS